MLGNIYLGMGDLKRADAQFKNVLERAEDDGPPGSKPVACKRDSYATGQLAWIQIQLAQAGASPAASILKACASASGVERLDKATEMLKKVLQAEPNNVFAANAIGVICVARGRLNEARQIFTQVREASPSCEAATANLAQINAALGEHATAVSFYDQIFKRAKAALDTTGGAGGDAAAGAGAASGGSSAGGVSEQRETLTTMLLLQVHAHLTTSHHISPHLTTPHHTSPHLTTPRRISPHLTTPHRISPHLTASHRISPHLTASHRISPHLYALSTHSMRSPASLYA